MKRLLREMIRRPWPSKSDRQAAIDAARERLEEARRRRAEVEQLVDWHADIRSRNHFREAFESSMRRG